MDRALLLLTTALLGAALCTNLRLAATALLSLGAALCTILHIAASCGRSAAFDFSAALRSHSSCAAANGGGATDVLARAFRLFTNRRFTADRRALPNCRALLNGRALPNCRALPNVRSLPNCRTLPNGRAAVPVALLRGSVAPALPAICATPAEVAPVGKAAAIPASTVPAIEIETIGAAFDDVDRGLLYHIGSIKRRLLRRRC
jgi:hypothetical protein